MEQIDYKKRIGDNINYFMTTRGMKRSELAKLVNCTEQGLGKYIRGEVEPGVDRLVVMADVFGVDIDSLVKKDCKSMYQTEVTRTAKDFGNTIVELMVLALSGDKNLWNELLFRNPQILNQIATGLLESELARKYKTEADKIRKFLDSYFEGNQSSYMEFWEIIYEYDHAKWQFMTN